MLLLFANGGGNKLIARATVLIEAMRQIFSMQIDATAAINLATTIELANYTS